MKDKVVDSNLITRRTFFAAADVMQLRPEYLDIIAVGGGYSRNRRSLVGSGDYWVFVKEVDPAVLPGDGQEELQWIKKDQLCVEKLGSLIPELLPDWSKLLADAHALVLPAYRSEDGWLWSPPEDTELQTNYIEAVVAATKKLESLQLVEKTKLELQLQPYFRDELAFDSGFSVIASDDTVRGRLIDKYYDLARTSSSAVAPKHLQIVTLLQNKSAFQDLATTAKTLANQPNNCFGHCDVRSDNLAYNKHTGEVKFVDWNWASYATKGFGATEFLVDMSRRGLDVRPWIADMNREMLAALVGYYLRHCLKAALAAGNTLRLMQAESAAVAYDLYLSELSPSK